jgi:hypothetical protein
MQSLRAFNQINHQKHAHNKNKHRKQCYKQGRIPEPPFPQLPFGMLIPGIRKHRRKRAHDDYYDPRYG